MMMRKRQDAKQQRKTGKAISVLGIVAALGCFLLISCSHKADVRPEERKTKQDILLIPYKSAPIQIQSSTLAAELLFGVGGQQVIRAGAREEGKKKSSALREGKAAWNPSKITADECSNILKNKSKVPVEVAAIAEVRELPEVDALRSKEPGVYQTAKFFGAEYTDISYQMSAWLKKDTPTLNYRQEYPKITADWALEITNSFFFMKEESMMFNVMLKIFDIQSGKLIATGATADQFKITPLAKKPDFPVFEKEFRNAARKMCVDVLDEMGLINESVKDKK